MSKILVTSALPYANGSIHIGHLVEYIQTDVLVRFLKLAGKDAIYVCADDTHGTPIEINAMKQGIAPEKLVEKYHKEHQEDFAKYNIKFDSYYSTNSKENKEYADLIFNRLKEKGLIYTKDVESFYDEEAKRFLPDRFVKGKCPKCGAEDQYGDVCESCNSTYKPIDLVEPYSTITKKKPIRKSSKHYFFKLSEQSKQIEEWLLGNKNLQPEIVNYLKNWIKEGLTDWDISRDGPYFGFKIPGEEDKYYYVWLDAPIGYISSTVNYCKDKDCKVEDYWNSKDSKIIHVIGKDIIYFHLLFWPAMLMNSGFNLPDTILVHGFLTVNNEKMSKSRGTFLTASEFAELTNPEFLRYYFAANLSKTMTDINLDLKDFESRVNNEVVSNFANFFYRTLSFLNRVDSTIDESDLEFAKKVTPLFNEVKKNFEKYEFRKAVNTLLQISAEGNKYFQSNEPWVLVKNDPKKAKLVLSTCANLAKNLAILLKPIMPLFAEKIEGQLNLKDLTFDDLGFELKNHKIGKAEIVYKKIEPIVLDKNKLQTNPFSKLNLKVAEVLSVKDHPNADRLFVLQLNLGTEKRQLVAGLKGRYEADELTGKHIVIVSNLEQAKLRGELSQGMLLASQEGETVGVLHAPNTKPGSQVFIEGVTPKEKKITYKEFSEVPLVSKKGKAYSDGNILKTEKEEIIVDKGLSGKIK